MSVCMLHYRFPRLLTIKRLQAPDHPHGARQTYISREQFLQIPGVGYPYLFCCSVLHADTVVLVLKKRNSFLMKAAKA